MSSKKIINWDKDFLYNEEDFKVSNEIRLLEEVRSDLILEFMYQGKYSLVSNLWKINLNKFIGMTINQAIVQIRNILQSKKPQYSGVILDVCNSLM